MNTFLIITSINHPTKSLREIASQCKSHGYSFVVVGDEKSPSGFFLDGCLFYSLEDQMKSGFRFAEACPTRHYARKNIGYLLAIRAGAKLIIETDDDNIPLSNFWNEYTHTITTSKIEHSGWINIYKYFIDKIVIWPRGLPLDAVNNPVIPYEDLSIDECFCPIQQGLANGDPDVDAIYRLIHPLPITFQTNRQIAIGNNAWCPFNSQNTLWWPEAYPLLYLPFYCSFRMTDIWRSLVAQRIAWLNDWYILFREPSVYQERNEHNLMKDFADEIPGYLNNRLIAELLEKIPLTPGKENLPENMKKCYRKLIEQGLIAAEEETLLDLWLEDLSFIT